MPQIPHIALPILTHDPAHCHHMVPRSLPRRKRGPQPVRRSRPPVSRVRVREERVFVPRFAPLFIPESFHEGKRLTGLSGLLSWGLKDFLFPNAVSWLSVDATWCQKWDMAWGGAWPGKSLEWPGREAWRTTFCPWVQGSLYLIYVNNGRLLYSSKAYFEQEVLLQSFLTKSAGMDRFDPGPIKKDVLPLNNM